MLPSHWFGVPIELVRKGYSWPQRVGSLVVVLPAMQKEGLLEAQKGSALLTRMDSE